MSSFLSSLLIYKEIYYVVHNKSMKTCFNTELSAD